MEKYGVQVDENNQEIIKEAQEKREERTKKWLEHMKTKRKDKHKKKLK